MSDMTRIPKTLFVVSATSPDGIVHDVVMCSVPPALAPEVAYIRADEFSALRAEVERLKAEIIGRQAHDRMQVREIVRLRAENERLRAALEPFACTCSVKGMGAGGNCTKGSGECMCWNARAALNDQPAPGKGE